MPLPYPKWTGGVLCHENVSEHIPDGDLTALDMHPSASTAHPLIIFQLPSFTQISLPSKTTPAPNHTQSYLHQSMIRSPSNTISSRDTLSPRHIRDWCRIRDAHSPPRPPRKKKATAPLKLRPTMSMRKTNLTGNSVCAIDVTAQGPADRGHHRPQKVTE